MNDPTRLGRIRLQMPFANGQQAAGRQADQVIRVRQGIRLIGIVHAPGEASFAIAPGAEILEMHVAHGQDFGRLRGIGTDL